MFRNKFLSTVLMSLCMVLCVMFFNTLTVEAANGTLKMEEDGKFHYYEGDRKVEDKYGFVEFEGSKFLVANGVVATDKSGLAIDPDNESDWYFLSNGLAQTQHTGLVEYDGEWFYVSEGKLDTTRNAYVKYDGGLFFVAVGRLVKEYQGLAKDPNGDDWYYVADGQAQIQYTGLAGYDGEYFYVQQGKFQKEFSGSVEYDGAYFKIVEGEMTEQVYGQKMELKSTIVSTYSAENKCIEYITTEYSDNEKITQSITYTGDGEKKELSKYDENGDITHVYEYDESGKEVLIQQYIYNDKGEVIEEYRYNAEGELSYHMIATSVNSAGLVVERETYYDEKEYNLSKVRDVFEYDKDGNQIKYISYVNDEEEPTSWSEYYYDSNGNMVKGYNCDSGGGIVGEIENVYDDNGNGIETKYYFGTKENGQIGMWYKFEYAEKGDLLKTIDLDAEGNVRFYYVVEYNKVGLQSANISYDKDYNVTQNTTFTYLYK